MIHDLTPTALDSPPGTPEFTPERRPASAGHLPGCAGHLFDGFHMTLHDFIVLGSSIWVRRLAFGRKRARQAQFWGSSMNLTLLYMTLMNLTLLYMTSMNLTLLYRTSTNLTLLYMTLMISISFFQDFNEFDLTLHDFDEFDLTLHDFNEFDMTPGRLDLVSM
jgi:hypothetical protein